ncbi:DNA starvation/stationary phase protection protein Dps [Tumidithrix elongata RA019]|uniref:DNA starvation/stationary phase protection protein Dps n=1 Tax=Tumidithrix elongata BACA0141 TaxID=2716417 RepID=A0AAW9Q585_9CYAN|nr:DNA starvation/stationary phase protection protein Dps [Tumidithrix elongata RA019]
MSSNHSPLYATRIDLAETIRIQTIAILNQTLASTIDLQTQVKQAHWNVKGHNFYQLHLLFDAMATELEEFVDMVAERITALGGYALGTARIAAKQSELEEYVFDAVEGMDHIAALADRFAIFAKSIRQNIHQTADLGDADTTDLYTEVSRAIDKRLWFLEAHLQTSAIHTQAHSIAAYTFGVV